MRAVKLVKLGYLICECAQIMITTGSLQFGLGLLDIGIGGGAGPPPSFA